MRQIKFRAFYVCENMMVLDYHTLTDLELYGFDNKDVLVTQYTGLKDKNGVEIYEGDIVKENRTKPLIVIYENEGYTPFTYCGGGEFYPEECEVIGNIYENPELLKP